MSEAKTEQPAVDAVKAPAVPGVPTGQDVRSNDGESVDALLDQFDASVKTVEPAKPQPKPEQKLVPAEAAKAPIDPDIAEIRGYITRQDINKAIGVVRGSLDPDKYDDALVEGYLNALATKDPRLAAAWQNRHNQPQAFQKILAAVGREFQKKHGTMPDRQATEDREAVTAAVRGASTKAPEGKAPDFSRMSTSEFREAHYKEYGYYPSV